MAIYHMSVQAIGREKGGNALAAAAYRSGEKIGEFDYSRREHQIDGKPKIYAPENAPSWVYDRTSLWTKVEESEKRKDAQLFREINIALPLELNLEAQQELLGEYAKIFTDLGMIADTVIHKGRDGQNPHAHIMLTTREINKDGFGKKQRDWNSRELLETWREKWAELANHALERAGSQERIDHRSLEAQGIDRAPTIHMGRSATWMERKGKETLKGEYNRTIGVMNELKKELKEAKHQAELAKIAEYEKSQEGKELIPIIEQLTKEQAAAQEKYDKCKNRFSSAKWDLDYTNEKIEKHNKDFKNMSLFQKFATGNREAELLEMDYDRQSKELVEAKSEFEEAEKNLAQINSSLNDMIRQYRQSPYGKAQHEESMLREVAQREQLRQEKIQKELEEKAKKKEREPEIKKEKTPEPPKRKRSLGWER